MNEIVAELLRDTSALGVWLLGAMVIGEHAHRDHRKRRMTIVRNA